MSMVCYADAGEWMKGMEHVAVRAHPDFFQQTEFKACFWAWERMVQLWFAVALAGIIPYHTVGALQRKVQGSQRCCRRWSGGVERLATCSLPGDAGDAIRIYCKTIYWSPKNDNFDPKSHFSYIYIHIYIFRIYVDTYMSVLKGNLRLAIFVCPKMTPRCGWIWLVVGLTKTFPQDDVEDEPHRYCTEQLSPQNLCWLFLTGLWRNLRAVMGAALDAYLWTERLGSSERGWELSTMLWWLNKG